MIARPTAAPSRTGRARRWLRRRAPKPGPVLPDPVLPEPRAGARERFAAWLRTLDRAARAIGGTIVLCLLSIWVVFCLVVHASYRENWDDASAYADSVAKLLAVDIETNFALSDLSLQALLSNLTNPALMSLPEELRHQAMFNSSMNLPIFGSLLVIDRDGFIRADARDPILHRIDVSDREYFKVQRDHRDVGLFVNHPFASRLTGEWMVGVSRRIDKDGAFDGVVLGGLRLDFLKALFLKVRLPDAGAVTLRYEDGTVMMSSLSNAVPWDPAMIKRAAASGDATVVRRSSDGVPCLVRVRKVTGLPLYQSVALPVASIMKDFWRRTLVTAAGFLFVSATIATLGVTLIRELSRRNAAEVQLQRLATIDGLTGLRNRRCFDEMLAAEIRRSARGGRPLALLMIDVDYFKAYNDNHGHSAGDAALRAVADILSGEPLRSSDVVARVGGEEFAVLAADTDLAGAARLAERIRCAVRGRRMPHVGSRMAVITVSIGLACFGEAGDAARDSSATAAGDWARSLFDEADAALYRAKRGGRDRAEVAQAMIGAAPTGAGGDRLSA